jgi:hypothetical protein
LLHCGLFFLIDMIEWVVITKTVMLRFTGDPKQKLRLMHIIYANPSYQMLFFVYTLYIAVFLFSQLWNPSISKLQQIVGSTDVSWNFMFSCVCAD